MPTSPTPDDRVGDPQTPEKVADDNVNPTQDSGQEKVSAMDFLSFCFVKPVHFTRYTSIRFVRGARSSQPGTKRGRPPTAF